jgi:DNA polymerase III epsilon subunit-like protein
MSEKKQLNVVWVDTETTGINPENSGAFELAFLVYKGGHFLEEKIFHLNPLTETIKFGEEAYKVNKVSEETIKSYPPAETVVREIADWLTPFLFSEEFSDKAEPDEDDKFVFAGYCAYFDYGHVKALFERYNISMDYFFSGRIIDVHELVKRASSKGVLPRTPNKKLETMTKALGIAHDGAHSALSDIKATRLLYETIYAMGRKQHP